VRFNQKFYFMLVCSVVAFNIVSCFTEFYFYATSDCKGLGVGFWLYMAIILTTLMKLMSLVFVYFDVLNNESMQRRVWKPFFVPSLILGSTPCLLITLYSYDYVVCDKRHPFFPLSFSEPAGQVLCIFMWIVLITLLILASIISRKVERA